MRTMQYKNLRECGVKKAATYVLMSHPCGG
jgi:hypothetical protein